jgi:hypothetical protein
MSARAPRARRNDPGSAGRSLDRTMNIRRPRSSNLLRLALASLLLGAGFTALAACDRSATPTIAAPAASPEGQTSPVDTSAKPKATGEGSSSAAPSTASAQDARGAASAKAQRPAAEDAGKARDAWSDLVQKLSEPDASFFSDNIISNETSYLQVTSDLDKLAKPGGAYIGVGPEQNFTYIALTKPKVAFIVDIRRQNMLLHLLYKAAFDEATSRSHFVTLLLGRPHEAASDPGAGASIEAVLAHAEKLPAAEATLTASHAKLRKKIERDYKIPLDATDKKNLELMHRSFFKKQLEVRFELKEANGRLYPTLREILSAADPGGARRGFLASEESFRLLQTMQREHRIIPVVGDFAGDRAMPGVAAHLKEQGVTVSAFYVSNVEQYLFEPGVWAKWMRNVAAMPTDDKSLFIRAYLDQGRKHPAQMKGHRTATVLQKIADFNAHQEKKPYQNFWSVATDAVLTQNP